MPTYRKATNFFEITNKALAHLASGNSGTPNCLQFGVTTTITTKMDGTQLRISLSIKDQEPRIELWGHSSKKPFFKGTLERLALGEQKGPKMVPITYQKVPVYAIVGSEIPKYLALMKEKDLTESDFYCEMILPNKSPLGLHYREDQQRKLYLFNHIYQVEDKWYLDEINPETLELYQKHQIRTVPVVKTFESFTVQDFHYLLGCIDNPIIEGFVLSQPNCLIKLKTHYYEAGIPEPVQINSEDQYQKDLLECFQALAKKIQETQVKHDHKDLMIIQAEIKKEYGHDDHTELVKEYFLKPAQDQHQFLEESDLGKRIFESLKKKPGKGDNFIQRNRLLILNEIQKFLRSENSV